MEDVYLIKTDSDGNEVWSKTFGGEKQEFGYSAQQTAEGGYIICGPTWSFGAGNWDVYLIKTDGEGNEVWSRTFGGQKRDIGQSVQQTADGGYIVTGTTESFGAGDFDAYLVNRSFAPLSRSRRVHLSSFPAAFYDVDQVV